MTWRITDEDCTELVRLIRRFMEAHGYAPSVRELAEMLGLASSSNAMYRLEKARAAGLITWEPGIARSIRVVGEVKA